MRWKRLRRSGGAVKRAAYELGVKFEECVEKILAARGYKTQRRVRVKGKKQVAHEIDVLARKGKRVIIVECKNWKAPVGKEVVMKLESVLRDLGAGYVGIIASYAGFTSDARAFAERSGIRLWERDYLVEEYFKVEVGRVECASLGRPVKVENALPLKVDFWSAAETNLKNQDKIKIRGVLSFHPYYVVSYVFHGKFKDPVGNRYTFDDEGEVFVDALDGSVLNPVFPAGLGEAVIQKLTRVISREKRERDKRIEMLMDEIDEGLDSVSNYSVEVGENYEVEKLPAHVNKQACVKAAKDYIIEVNTEEITYTVDEEEGLFSETETVTYVPKARDIKIRRVALVYVPKWKISYDAFGRVYSREVFAFSGEVLEDSIRFCPKHFKLRRRETVAVCEVCGVALCSDHIFQCPICGKWLCEEHGVFCGSCDRIFCEEHNLETCELCGEPVCDDCRRVCRICGVVCGVKHMRVCSVCGEEACEKCTVTKGFIRRKTVCRNCLEKT